MTETRLTPVEVLHRYANMYETGSNHINRCYHRLTAGFGIGGTVLIFIKPELTILLGLAGISTWAMRKYTLTVIDNMLTPLMRQDLLRGLRTEGDENQENQMGSRPPPRSPMPPGSLSPVLAPIRPILPSTEEGALAEESVEEEKKVPSLV